MSKLLGITLMAIVFVGIQGKLILNGPCSPGQYYDTEFKTCYNTLPRRNRAVQNDVSPCQPGQYYDAEFDLCYNTRPMRKVAVQNDASSPCPPGYYHNADFDLCYNPQYMRNQAVQNDASSYKLFSRSIKNRL